MIDHKKLAADVEKYVMENKERKLTIEDIAREFGVSASLLKNVFKEVHGVPMYAYFRRKKMAGAARDLLDTRDSVLEIAGRYGYENGSKFAKAFRDEMGTSPRCYRNKLGI